MSLFADSTLPYVQDTTIFTSGPVTGSSPYSVVVVHPTSALTLTATFPLSVAAELQRKNIPTLVIFADDLAALNEFAADVAAGRTPSWDLPAARARAHTIAGMLPTLGLTPALTHTLCASEFLSRHAPAYPAYLRTVRPITTSTVASTMGIPDSAPSGIYRAVLVQTALCAPAVATVAVPALEGCDQAILIEMGAPSAPAPAPGAGPIGTLGAAVGAAVATIACPPALSLTPAADTPLPWSLASTLFTGAAVAPEWESALAEVTAEEVDALARTAEVAPTGTLGVVAAAATKKSPIPAAVAVAPSGGRDTLAQQLAEGANLDADASYRYLHYFLPAPVLAKVTSLYGPACAGGRGLLSGDVKGLLTRVLVAHVYKLQAALPAAAAAGVYVPAGATQVSGVNGLVYVDGCGIARRMAVREEVMTDDEVTGAQDAINKAREIMEHQDVGTPCKIAFFGVHTNPKPSKAKPKPAAFFCVGESIYAVPEGGKAGLLSDRNPRAREDDPLVVTIGNVRVLAGDGGSFYLRAAAEAEAAPAPAGLRVSTADCYYVATGANSVFTVAPNAVAQMLKGKELPAGKPVGTKVVNGAAREVVKGEDGRTWFVGAGGCCVFTEKFNHTE